MGKASFKFGATDEGLIATVKKIRGEIKGMGSDTSKAAKEASGSFDAIKSSAMKVGGMIAGAFAFHKISSGISGLMQEIDDLGKTATRLRLPVGEVQVLSLAAQHADTNIDAIAKSMGRAQVAASEAGRGVKRYTEEFSRLGINVAEFQQMDHAGRLRVIADAYSNATDKGEAYTSLTRIMGRGALELLPLLTGGADGIDAITDSIQKLDDTDVRAIEEMNDSITTMKTSIKTAAMQLLIDFKPAMESAMELAKEATKTMKAFADSLQFGTIHTGATVGEAILLMKEIEKHESNAFWYGTRRLDNMKERLAAMPEEIRLQADIAKEVEKLSDIYSTGAISKEEMIARARLIRGEVDMYNEGVQATKDAEEAEKQKAMAAREAADAAADYAKEQDKADKELSKLLPKLGEKVALLDTLPDQLMGVAESIAEIYNAFDASSVEELQELMDSATDPVKKLELANALNNLLSLVDQQAKIEGQITAEKAKQQDANKRLADQDQKAVDKAERLLELEEARTKARRDFERETKLLRMEAEGNADIANALREEIKLRDDAVKMAKDLGIAEDEALKKLREQNELRKEIAGNAERVKDAAIKESNIRKSDRDIAKELGIDTFDIKTRKELRDAIEQKQKELRDAEIEKARKQLEDDNKKQQQEKAKEKADAKDAAKDAKDAAKDAAKGQNETEKMLGKIQTAVDNINKLVGIIEPKLPTPSLI